MILWWYDKEIWNKTLKITWIENYLNFDIKLDKVLF